MSETIKARLERGEILHTFKYQGRTYVQWGADKKIGGCCSLAAWREAVRDGYLRAEMEAAKATNNVTA